MKQRILTAIIAIIIFVPIILYGGWPFIIVAYLLSAIALYELLRMYRPGKVWLYMVISTLFLWLLVYPNVDISLGSFVLTKFDILTLFFVVLMLIIVLSKNKFTFNDAGFLLIATFYIGTAFYLFSVLRMAGLNYFLFVLFIIWATDIAAYFSGRFFGKRKLWPEISPNKTIAGAVGGLAVAVVVALVFHLVYPFSYSLPFIILIAVIISVFGQLGDLVASAIKRHYQVKDSGTIFPGHGGIIDRLDSLLFVVIILHVIQFI